MKIDWGHDHIIISPICGVISYIYIYSRITVTLKASDHKGALTASSQHIVYGDMDEDSFIWHDRSCTSRSAISIFLINFLKPRFLCYLLKNEYKQNLHMVRHVKFEHETIHGHGINSRSVKSRRWYGYGCGLS